MTIRTPNAGTVLAPLPVPEKEKDYLAQKRAQKKRKSLVARAATAATRAQQSHRESMVLRPQGSTPVEFETVMGLKLENDGVEVWAEEDLSFELLHVVSKEEAAEVHDYNTQKPNNRRQNNPVGRFRDGNHRVVEGKGQPVLENTRTVLARVHAGLGSSTKFHEISQLKSKISATPFQLSDH